jgi:hypothetical protein
MEERGTRSGYHDRRVPLNNPARIFQPLVKALGWTGADQDCGLNTQGLLAKYDRISRSWKMSEPSRSGDSTAFSFRLPKSGTLRNGRIFGPAMWERSTNGSGSGLWRTPIASDGDHHSAGEERMESLIRNGMVRESGKKAQICLRDQVKHPALFPKYDRFEIRKTNQKKLFPAPCAQDYKRCGPGSRQKGLPDVIRFWPTSTARDYKDGSKSSCANVPVKGLLGRAVHEDSATEGQLSAGWTEALMGYPPGWTDIEKECGFKNRFPGAWHDGTWESGIPRVTKKQKFRRHRIEALGNSIVPQIPYLMFMTKEFDRFRKEQL